MVSPLGGLTTPAIPPWQWVGLPQKNQMGFVSVTVTWKTEPVPVAVFLTVPLSKPPLDWHGLAKEPSMTEWMEPKKWNSSTSPTLAVVESGEKDRPLWPTSMTTVAAAARAAPARRRSERMAARSGAERQTSVDRVYRVTEPRKEKSSD